METDDRLRCLKQLLQTHTAERSGGWDTTVPGLALCRWTAPSQAQTWTYERVSHLRFRAQNGSQSEITRIVTAPGCTADIRGYPCDCAGL